MFDRIAPTYDFLNTLLSGGQHESWARRLLRRAEPAEGERWLDLATGSGPMIAQALRRQPRTEWIGLDPSAELLRVARKRTELRRTPFLLGYGEELPFEDGRFDGITIAYGLRNYADPVRGLAEMHRVLKPGGRLYVLEFHREEVQGGWGMLPLARWYLKTVIPMVGKLVSGDDGAYDYLARTAGGFWTESEFREHLERIGFDGIQQVAWMFGSVTLTTACRP